MRRWNKLLNEGRFRESAQDPKDLRTQFERDYDRIVYSSAFRRLQDKAQVFPLERKDFVRTRLTHSIEVSSLARSLGVDTARQLIKKGKLPSDKNIDYSFGNILSSIALIHDLGNPPFGHFGESSLGNWFKYYFHHRGVTCGLNEIEKKDFTEFEGNAQTFRIVTKLQVLKDQYGLNLTYATLSSLFKYPRASKEVDKQKGASYKKFGYFLSENEQFERVKEETGLKGHRHPLVFILEAADDIAYSAGDVEDGFKKGVLSWEELNELLKDKLESEDKDLLDRLSKTEKDLRKGAKPEPRYNAVQDFRIAAQSKMFRDCASIFVKNIDGILDGSFDSNLLEVSNSSSLFYVLKDELGIKKIYSSEEVLRQEIVSSKVINGLLEMLVDSIMSEKYEDKKCFEGKLYSLISPNFKHIFEKSTKRTVYNKLRLVTDYVSGMTDSYALELYQRFWGFKV